MKMIVVMVAAILAGCATAPNQEVCDVVEAAQQEASMPAQWHVAAAKVLAACGVPGAAQEGETRACFARKADGADVQCQELVREKK